ncbi:MAG: sugar ABC transporter permease [Chloroflexota bacterium]
MSSESTNYAGLDTSSIAPPQPSGLRRIWTQIMKVLDDARLVPVLLIAPVLIFFLVWNVVPTLWMIGLSFYKYQITLPDTLSFIGVENYVDIFTDRSVWRSMSRTFIWVGVGVSIQTVLGMLLGYLFWGSKDMPGRRIALTMIFTPMIITPVASGLFWRLIYEPTFGIINWFTKSAFNTEILFLQDTTIAFWSVIFVDIWMWTPFMMLMTLAALGSVPKAELEAAEIDRLSWIDRFRFVLLPNGKFILMLGILLRTIDSFKTLDLVYLMAVPGSSTELIAVALREEAFEALDVGWSSALAIILLLTAIAFTSIYLYILNLNSQQQEVVQ